MENRRIRKKALKKGIAFLLSLAMMITTAPMDTIAYAAEPIGETEETTAEVSDGDREEALEEKAAENNEESTAAEEELSTEAETAKAEETTTEAETAKAEETTAEAETAKAEETATETQVSEETTSEETTKADGETVGEGETSTSTVYTFKFNIENAHVYRFDEEAENGKGEEIIGGLEVAESEFVYDEENPKIPTLTLLDFVVEPADGYTLSEVACNKSMVKVVSGGGCYSLAATGFGKTIEQLWTNIDTVLSNLTVSVIANETQEYTVTFSAPENVTVGAEGKEITGNQLTITDNEQLTFDVSASTENKGFIVTCTEEDSGWTETLNHSAVTASNDDDYTYTQTYEYGKPQRNLTMTVEEVDLVTVSLDWEQVSGLSVSPVVISPAISESELLTTKEGGKLTSTKIPKGSSFSFYADSEIPYNTFTASVNDAGLAAKYDSSLGVYVYTITPEEDTTIVFGAEPLNITLDYSADECEVSAFIYSENGNEEITFSEDSSFMVTEKNNTNLSLKMKAAKDNMRPTVSFRVEEGEGTYNLSYNEDIYLEEDGYWYCMITDYSELNNIKDGTIAITFAEYHAMTFSMEGADEDEYIHLEKYYKYEEEDYSEEYWEEFDAFGDDEESSPRCRHGKEFRFSIGGSLEERGDEYRYNFTVECISDDKTVTLSPQYYEGDPYNDIPGRYYYSVIPTADIHITLKAQKKEWHEVTVTKTDDVGSFSVEGDYAEQQGTGTDTWSVIDGEKIGISITPTETSCRGTLAVTVGGEKKEYDYKANYFSVEVTSDMQIEVGAAAVTVHTLSIADESRESLNSISLYLFEGGEYNDTRSLESTSCEISDEKSYWISFAAPKPGKKISRVEAVYGTGETRELEPFYNSEDIDDKNGNAKYDLGYGISDITVNIIFSDAYTVTFDGNLDEVYDVSDYVGEEDWYDEWGRKYEYGYVYSINEQSTPVETDKSLYFVVGERTEKYSITANSDSFNIETKRFNRISDGEEYSVYYYVLSPIEGKEIPEGVMLSLSGTASGEEKTYTFEYDDDSIKNICLYGGGDLINTSATVKSDRLGSKKEVTVYGSQDLTLSVMPIGSRKVTVTKKGANDTKAVEVESYLSDEGGSHYFYLGKVTEDTTVTITTESVASIRYYNVGFLCEGSVFVYEGEHSMRLDTLYYSDGSLEGWFYAIEAGKSISFFYDEPDNYKIGYVTTTTDEAGKIEPKYDEMLGKYVYTITPTKNTIVRVIEAARAETSEVTFTYPSEIVSVNVTGHTLDDNKVSVDKGTELKFTLDIINHDYVITDVTADGTSIALNEAQNCYILSADKNTMKVTVFVQKQKYTVHFELQGKGENKTESVESGTKITKPEDPAQEGWIFGGWYKEAECRTAWDFENDTVTADTTLYAKWTQEETPSVTTYMVTFDLQGHGAAIESVTVNSGEKTARPADPSEAGWIFGGWYKEAECKTVWDFENDTVTADTTLYAKWTQQAEDSTDRGVEWSYPENIKLPFDLVDISGAAVSAIKAKVYDGQPYEPSVKVTIKDSNGKTVTLTEGTDYRVEYKNNINAGTGEVIIKGNGMYTGEKAVCFTISQKPLKKVKAVTGGMIVGDVIDKNDLSELPVYVYDGNDVLEFNSDYTLSITKSDIDSATGTINKKGNIEVEIKATGTGNYTSGSNSVLKAKIPVYEIPNKNFKGRINATDVSFKNEADKSQEYTGKALKPEFKVVQKDESGNETTLDKKYYSVKYQNNKEAGTAYAVVTGKGGYVGSVVMSFEITSVQASENASEANFKIVQIKDVTYNGKLQKPKVAVKATVDGKEKTLKAGKDYRIYYTNNLHASVSEKDGDKAKVTIVGINNFADFGTQYAYFTIKPLAIKKVSVKGTKGNLTVTYAKHTLVENYDYKVTYVDDAGGRKTVATIEGFYGSEGENVNHDFITDPNKPFTKKINIQ